MTESPVLLDLTEGIATITLNRPEAMNSLNIATKELLRDTVQQVAADDAVRAVVLTGTGRGFCVGQDLKEHIELLEAGDSDALFTTVALHYNPTVTALATMPKPVVAAINGVAAGAGASLAMACDLRVLAEQGGFNFAFAGVALSCDTGSSYLLPRIVGRAKALELLYFPRTAKAEECLELGLATELAADPLGRAQELAAQLAQGPTAAYAAIRASVDYAADHSFAEALEFEGTQMTATGKTADHRAAVEAFVAKRKPVFSGR